MHNKKNFLLLLPLSSNLEHLAFTFPENLQEAIQQEADTDVSQIGKNTGQLSLKDLNWNDHPAGLSKSLTHLDLLSPWSAPLRADTSLYEVLSMDTTALQLICAVTCAWLLLLSYWTQQEHYSTSTHNSCEVLYNFI